VCKGTKNYWYYANFWIVFCSLIFIFDYFVRKYCLFLTLSWCLFQEITKGRLGFDVAKKKFEGCKRVVWRLQTHRLEAAKEVFGGCKLFGSRLS
jgi:hypothetical protein